jgi:hypothetical protein
MCGLLLLTVFTLGSAGCAALVLGAVAAGGAAGYAYYQGSVPRDYHADVDQTWTATQYALQDLGLPVSKAEKQGAGGVIESVTPKKNKIYIQVEPSPASLPPDPTVPPGPATRVHVRVNTFGDHDLSDWILDQVEQRLLAMSPQRPNAVPIQTPVPTATPLPQETSPPPLATPVTVPGPPAATPAVNPASK